MRGSLLFFVQDSRDGVARGFVKHLLPPVSKGIIQKWAARDHQQFVVREKRVSGEVHAAEDDFPAPVGIDQNELVMHRQFYRVAVATKIKMFVELILHPPRSPSLCIMGENFDLHPPLRKMAQRSYHPFIVQMGNRHTENRPLRKPAELSAENIALQTGEKINA